MTDVAEVDEAVMAAVDIATSDILIIGSGAAGLALALSLADNANVSILSKNDILAGSSQYAQGGIAAVLEQTSENIESHIHDTLIAGDGLCNPDVVRFTVTHAKAAIQWLIDRGVQFTTLPNSKKFHLTQEGGHSQRRILHAADRTGVAIVKTLIEQVFAHPNIRCYSQHTAIDLIQEEGRCTGAYVLDNNTGDINIFHADKTILATGGASSVYRHTTNPDFTSGDGIAMAWRSGAEVNHLEFNQFHPTSLYYSGNTPFLISEVLRGEGGKLILNTGQEFMSKYDTRQELAPRDIVARAIHNELLEHQLDCVYLDITHLPNEIIQSHFPTIYHFCYQQGVDIMREPIPVVPAAHYTCGGVVTDTNAQTSIPNLYAIGEVACTGLHGANRMASNSLLECLVFATSAGQAILKSLNKNNNFKMIQKYNKNHNQQSFNIEEKIKVIRQIMWDNVGIVRSHSGLSQAGSKIKTFLKEIDEAFKQQKITRELIEYRNLVHTANLITKNAIERKENLGLHYNADLCVSKVT